MGVTKQKAWSGPSLNLVRLRDLATETRCSSVGITSSNAGLVVCIQHGGDQAVLILVGRVDRVATVLELIQGSLAHDDAIGCQV